jgi:hypothetical protein
MMNAPQPILISVQKASAETLLAVNFSLIMPDVITEVLSSLFTGKAINELFTGRIFMEKREDLESSRQGESGYRLNRKYTWHGHRL